MNLVYYIQIQTTNRGIMLDKIDKILMAKKRIAKDRVIHIMALLSIRLTSAIKSTTIFSTISLEQEM